MTGRDRTGLAAFGLLGLALVVLRDALFFERSFFERDLVWVYLAEVEAFVRAIREGALPLRDPTTGFGQPIMGNPESQVLYPLTWLHLVLPPDRALSFIVFLHYLIGASGAAALCWRASRRGWASFFAGAFWMVSGPFQSTLNLWHHFAGTAWMPWVLVALDRLLEKPAGVSTAVLGAVFGVQILAGSADLCAMTLLLALLRVLCEGRALVKRSILPGSAAILGSVLLALGLGAGMWMPVLDVVSSSLRRELPREARTEWSIHPLVATELLLPTGMGTLPMTPEASRTLTDGRPPFLKSLFLGPLILPLMAAGLINPLIPRKYRTFLVLGVLAAALVALGRYTPVYDSLVALAPPLRMFRYPAKALLPLSLLACVLAGIGSASLEGRRQRYIAIGTGLGMLALNALLHARVSGLFGPFLDSSRPAMIAESIAKAESGLLASAVSLGLLLVALALRRPRFVEFCVLVGVAVTLVTNAGINPTVAQAAVRFRPPHLDLFSEKEPGRLYAFDYLHYPARSAAIFERNALIVPEKAWGLEPAQAFIMVVRSALMAPTGGSWGIEYAWDRDLRGLFDRTLSGLTLHVRNVEGQPAFLRMLQLANVTRVAALHTSGFEPLTLEATIPLPLPEPLYIFRVPEPRPRAYAVSGARQLGTEEAQAALLDPAFNPATEVVIGEGRPSAVSRTFEASLTMVVRRSDRISLDAQLNEPGHIVLLEGFLPGWRATLDGVSVPVRRANALFLAIEAPAGRHRVVFTYRPWSALAGMSLSGFTAALLLIALARHLRRQWRA